MVQTLSLTSTAGILRSAAPVNLHLAQALSTWTGFKPQQKPPCEDLRCSLQLMFHSPEQWVAVRIVIFSGARQQRTWNSNGNKSSRRLSARREGLLGYLEPFAEPLNSQLMQLLAL